MTANDQLERDNFFDVNRQRVDVSETSPEVINEVINESPILQRYLKLPDFSKSFDVNPPKLDNSLAYIPVYEHLVTYDLMPIERPRTPKILKKLRLGAMKSKILTRHASNSIACEIDDQDTDNYCGAITRCSTNANSLLKND